MAGYSDQEILNFVLMHHYACTRCLSIGHLAGFCERGWRCLKYFNLGHYRKNCPSEKPNSYYNLRKPGFTPSQVWVRKDQDLACSRCLASGHIFYGLSATPRCQLSYTYGHSIVGGKQLRFSRQSLACHYS